VPDVLLASCAAARGRDDDEPLLMAALADVGLTPEVADWADPSVDWAAARLVVVRSTWNYAPHRAEFLAWARRVEAVTRLLNPADVLAWNTDKRYLHELAGAGLSVVPTAWAELPDELPEALDRWPGHLVVKPVVSAGARDTARFGPGERAAARALAERILASGRAVMVQPYLARLEAEGETGLVHLDGVFSHAFGKGALLAGGPLGEGLFAAEAITPREATPQQRALAAAVLDAVRERTGATPLYARVDLVPGDDGTPQVLELELTEPSLFLGTDPGAAQRTAAAIAGRLS
jgi:glutathione synthase/RimK-type ligase-like ATP-grasp enzyme